MKQEEFGGEGSGMRGKHYRCWNHEGRQALAPLGLGEHLLASTVGPWQLGNFCSLETNVHLVWWAQKQGFFSRLALLSKLKQGPSQDGHSVQSGPCFTGRTVRGRWRRRCSFLYSDFLMLPNHFSQKIPPRKDVKTQAVNELTSLRKSMNSQVSGSS